MRKMVTFVPEDPKLVLALPINEGTWDYFAALFPNNKPPLDKDAVLGGYIVVPVDTEATWGWMTKENFEEMYKHIEQGMRHSFTTFRAV